ncbi:MAG: hypothetical protein KA368_10950 [Acidobacteria bacterium]|nr:hypothetical protein [Acidobacteriota bacterium]
MKEQHLSVLSDLVAKSPDATLDELREQMKKQARVAVSVTTIWRGLDNLNLSRKKSPSERQKPIRLNEPSSKRNRKGSR